MSLARTLIWPLIAVLLQIGVITRSPREPAQAPLNSASQGEDSASAGGVAPHKSATAVSSRRIGKSILRWWALRVNDATCEFAVQPIRATPGAHIQPPLVSLARGPPPGRSG